MNSQKRICNEISDQQPDFFKGSLDVNFLFTNTPFEVI